MTRVGLVFGWVLAGCGGDKQSGQGLGGIADTAALDTGVTGPSYPDCETVAGGSGLAVGEALCEAGRCFVPDGPFWMGAEEADACPVRSVSLDAFWIDQFEVSNGGWDVCVAAGQCEAVGAACHFEIDGHQTEKQAVTCVDWSSAAEYCTWKGGRLPTEAQWEKAARGTDQAQWSWGSASPSCLLANYRFSKSYCFPGITEVGFFADNPSPFGLFDSVGNAWEWVSDWYDPNYYRHATPSNPPGPACELGDVHGTGACTRRVIRGGAYNTTKLSTRSHSRSATAPTVQDDNIGFRCAYDHAASATKVRPSG